MKYLLIIPLFFLLSCQGETPEVTRSTVLYSIAKQDILSRLKAPSTAVFTDSLSTLYNLTDAEGVKSNKWRVQITADAQNSYGAMLRNRYMLVYRYDGTDSISADSYVLENFYD